MYSLPNDDIPISTKENRSFSMAPIVWGGRMRPYLLFILVAGNLATAQQARLPLEVIQVERGLSEGSVWAIEEDDSGFLWLGTSNGLNRFDGYSFTVHRATADPTFIAGNEVRALLFQSPHTLWVGTSEGLTRFNVETGVGFTYRNESPNSVPGSYIMCLAASERYLWVGTRTGLGRLDKVSGDWLVYRHSADDERTLVDDQIRAIAFQGKRFLWVGSAQGIHRISLEDGTLSRIAVEDEAGFGKNRGEIRSVVTRNEIVLIGHSAGLYQLDPTRDVFGRIAIAPEDRVEDPFWVNDLVFDKEGALWVATRRHGVQKVDLNQGRILEIRDLANDRGLQSDNALTVRLGRSNLLWIGMYKTGLAKLDLKPRKFISYDPGPFPGHAVEAVAAILEDSSGTLWLGTHEGLIQHDSNETTLHHKRSDGPYELSGNGILSLHEDKRGRIWVGTYADGLNILDLIQQKNTVFRHIDGDPKSLPHDVVRQIVADSNGNHYLGTRAGLFRFEPEEGTLAEVPLFGAETTSERRIQAIMFDSNDVIWAGTSGGLYRYSRFDDIVTRFTHDSNDNRSLSNNTVTALLESELGGVWVGTSMGLNYLSPKSGDFDRYGEGQGMIDTFISGLASGFDGDIWISTNRGLTRRQRSGELSHYDHRDGLQGNEFMQGSITKTRDGSIFVGGISGYSKFQPAHLATNPFKPEVRVTRFRILDDIIPLTQVLDDRGVLNLSHRERYFSFELSALEYTSPSKNRYSYQLQGSENAQWHDLGSHRQVGFTNLPGGDYTLRVRASNNDGVWSDQALEIPIHITPPIWQRSWAIALASLILIGALLFVHKWRLREDRRRRKELISVVAERTESLVETRQALIEQAQKAGAGEMVTGLLHNLGNIMTSVIISVEEMIRIIKVSKVSVLIKTCNLVKEHQRTLFAYLKDDPKGKLVPQFINETSHIISSEYSRLRSENFEIGRRVSLMVRAIQTEQDYAEEYEERQVVDVTKLIDDSLQMFVFSFAKRDLQVVRDIQLIPMCRLNPYKMIHIFSNLIKNAADAIHAQHVEKGGVIRISACSEDGAFVKVEISDNGCGIDSEKISRLFDYGFTTKSFGHGFGLYSCATSLKEIGGFIDVVSEGQGMGATFTIRIPVDGSKVMSHAP